MFNCVSCTGFVVTKKMKKSAVALYCGTLPTRRTKVHTLRRNSGEGEGETERERERGGGGGGRGRREGGIIIM